jgi:NADPH:quinone reductase
MDKAILLHRYGGPEELQLVPASAGVPGRGEVRIRHHAIGVNFTDVYHRTGVHPVKYPLPMGLGMEGAGVVEAVGPGVEHLRAGDRVAYASHPPGSYSDVRVMPAQNVCVLPDGVDFETAAAVMLKGLTVQCLLRQCLPMRGLQPGDHVLFHAAAGGVGLVACQWARALGLKLIATAGSSEKCRLALEHGATHAIDYRADRFADRVLDLTEGRGVKVVYDSVGRDTFEGSLACLQRFGLLVSFGDASGPPPPLPMAALAAKSLFVTRQTVFNFVTSREATQAMADELFALVAGGQVKVRVAQRYALEAAADAHRALESRRTTGATILTTQ